jgi:hypothetical protein
MTFAYISYALAGVPARDLMQMAPCNPAVGNVRNNGPEMLVCPTPMEPLSLLNSA